MNVEDVRSMPCSASWGRWRYHRATKAKASKWVMTDPMGRKHWVTKFDAQKLCVIGYAGERTDWMVQEPSAARDAVECMVRSVESQTGELSDCGRKP